MKLAFRNLLALASMIVLTACSSIAIVKPKDGAINVRMPQPIEITEQGYVSFGDLSLDGFNMSRYNASSYQYFPRSTFNYVPLGQHRFIVSATDFKFNQNISEVSTFTVSDCPLCYSCPVGTVHPIEGQCCENGICDVRAFTNFGPLLFTNQKCKEPLFPGSNIYYNDLDCIRPSGVTIRGTGVMNPQMFAVSFSTGAGALAQIQVPIGWTSGQNGVALSIASDNNGNPGTILETMNVNNIRTQPLPGPVNSPVHIFSAQRPSLALGTYWLIISPVAADTVVQWNFSVDDFSIPNTTTLLVNDSTSNVSGPWRRVSNLVEPRPAFEVDIRP